MTKKELLQSIAFGESVAEQEAEKLKNYFLQTEYWKLVRNGSNDIIYGAKGTGKSAISTLASKWAKTNEDTYPICKKLSDIGFFEEKGSLSTQKYKIPFIYRPYLAIVQGVASGEDE